MLGTDPQVEEAHSRWRSATGETHQAILTIVLADDQLPPTIMSKEKPVKVNGGSTGADAEVDIEELDIKDRTRLKPPRTLETTLFDRLEKLYGEGIKRVLRVQYR